MSTQSNHTDEELLSQFRNDPYHGFELIYSRYAGELYRYIRCRVHMQEDAEELVQDVFESLWERRETIQIDSLRHYLFSSVRYMVIRYISKKKVKQRYADHFLAFESLYYTLEEHDNESSSIRNRILEVMREMPERCQLAIKLRITENLSNSEIASRMNITKKTVELYMSKALSHLRTALRGAEFFIFLGGSIGYYTHLLALTNP